MTASFSSGILGGQQSNNSDVKLQFGSGGLWFSEILSDVNTGNTHMIYNAVILQSTATGLENLIGFGWGTLIPRRLYKLVVVLL